MGEKATAFGGCSALRTLNLDVWLEKLAPHDPVDYYHHNRTGEDNADAHLKRQIMGLEGVVAITKGQLDFGPLAAPKLDRSRRSFASGGGRATAGGNKSLMASVTGEAGKEFS